MDDRHGHFRPDLKDFTRYGTLDAYELTDEEIAALLEVWRWTSWRTRETPADEVRDRVAALQRQLAHTSDVEVEYNTAGLLKGAIEPLIYLRVLVDLPRALLWFARHPLALARALLAVRRLRRVQPARGQNGEPLGYPIESLPPHLYAPDLLKTTYWKQVSPFTFAERKRLDYWW
jgi:hypothetical protein